MNAVGLISISQSGVLIRGCEVPDVFVKVERSFSEIEEDELDLTMTDCSSFSVTQDISLSLSESDSGWFDSEDKTESGLSDVAASESRTQQKIKNVNFSGWGGRRRRDQGFVLHRTSPLGRPSNPMMLQQSGDRGPDATPENAQDGPIDCVVS